MLERVFYFMFCKFHIVVLETADIKAAVVQWYSYLIEDYVVHGSILSRAICTLRKTSSDVRQQKVPIYTAILALISLK
jgi:hypothetical protein